MGDTANIYLGHGINKVSLTKKVGNKRKPEHTIRMTYFINHSA